MIFSFGETNDSDFDQVDKYLVVSSKIFANGKVLKEIDKESMSLTRNT
jgi:hypothetical protein